MKKQLSAMAVLCVLLAGCDNVQKVEVPSPVSVSRDAQGFFCGMIIEDHPGPKAQVFRRNSDQPFWFPSVRDAIAYSLFPGEAGEIVVTYVSDMTGYTDWNNPPQKWIKIQSAFFVLNSNQTSGMAAQGLADPTNVSQQAYQVGEVVPFSTRTAAEGYVKNHGGNIVRYNEIPQSYVLDSGAPPETKS
jgi:copper chaperone NosL